MTRAAALTSVCGANAVGAAPRVALGTADGIVALMDPRDLHLVSAGRAHSDCAAALARLPPSAGGSASQGVTLLSGGWDKRVVRHEMD